MIYTSRPIVGRVGWAACGARTILAIMLAKVAAEGVVVPNPFRARTAAQNRCVAGK
jgi:hypothetical protein